MLVLAYDDDDVHSAHISQSSELCMKRGAHKNIIESLMTRRGSDCGAFMFSNIVC